MFKRSHYFAIAGFSLLFLVLFFGFDTKPKSIKLAEKSRVNLIENTNIQNLLMEARGILSPDEAGIIDALMLKLELAESDSAKIQAYKDLSSNWYRRSFYGIAGFYAEEVAKKLNDENSWSIAGTTYATGLTEGKTEKEKEFCASRARNAFEQAISINPDNWNHKVNLAVTFAEFPLANDPMKGIMMLMDFNKQVPDNTSVLYQLARLGIKTGQFEKAEQRIERILELEPDNKRAHCLMIEIQTALNNQSAADFHRSMCKDL